MTETMEERITRLLLEYAQNVPSEKPFPSHLSIRRDLAVESLSLVAVTLSLGDELSVDATEAGIDFAELDTVGDLVKIGHQLAGHDGEPGRGSPNPSAPAPPAN